MLRCTKQHYLGFILRILRYILSMATYILDRKTARIFALVKNVHASG